MKHRLIYLAALLSALLPVLAGAATPGADAILSQLRTKITSAPSVEAVFTINSGQSPMQGSVILAGSKYMMDTKSIKVWYDGKTQWTLLSSSQEVSITEPTADELMSSNPFAILTAHADYYRSKRLPDSNGCYRIELQPRESGSGILCFELTVNKSSGWPESVTVTFEDKRKVTVKIDSISTGKVKAASTFSYDAKKFPAFEIVDMR